MSRRDWHDNPHGIHQRTINEATEARCESRTGGGRYQCCKPAGHEGKHQAAGLFTTWAD